MQWSYGVENVCSFTSYVHSKYVSVIRPFWPINRLLIKINLHAKCINTIAFMFLFIYKSVYMILPCTLTCVNFSFKSSNGVEQQRLESSMDQRRGRNTDTLLWWHTTSCILPMETTHRKLLQMSMRSPFNPSWYQTLGNEQNSVLSSYCLHLKKI